jgi:hypothetical protein
MRRAEGGKLFTKKHSLVQFRLRPRLCPQVCSVMVSIVPVVVMVSLTSYAAINNSHLQRAIQPERYNGVAGNSDGPAMCLAPVDRSHDGAYEAVIASRFDAVWIGSDGITLPIDNNRFQIEYQVIIGSNPDDQFGVGAPWDRDTPILTPDILIHGSDVNAIVLSLDVY